MSAAISIQRELNDRISRDKQSIDQLQLDISNKNQEIEIKNKQLQDLSNAYSKYQDDIEVYLIIS